MNPIIRCFIIIDYAKYLFRVKHLDQGIWWGSMALSWPCVISALFSSGIIQFCHLDTEKLGQGFDKHSSLHQTGLAKIYCTTGPISSLWHTYTCCDGQMWSNLSSFQLYLCYTTAKIWFCRYILQADVTTASLQMCSMTRWSTNSKVLQDNGLHVCRWLDEIWYTATLNYQPWRPVMIKHPWVYSCHDNTIILTTPQLKYWNNLQIF